MRNPTLHALLRAYVEEAGVALALDARKGDGVPFDVRESHADAGWKPRTPLYCYRPLTGEFIAEREDMLAGLPTWLPAVRALERLEGLDAYLRRRDLRGEPPARAALAGLTDAAYSGSSDFAFVPERFGRAYAELEGAVYAGRTVSTVAVELLGVEVESDELVLSSELRLVMTESWPDAPEGARRPGVLAVVTPAEARPRLRRLLTALRLWDRATPALGASAWTRIDDGPWRTEPNGAGGRARGTLVVPEPQEDELRAFCSLVARRTPRAGELAWALGRFEMGCERTGPFEALTDDLLALRALLEPEGPASGRLAERVAALCAAPEERAPTAERVARAVALERNVVAGLPPVDPEAEALPAELADHLRALLRDVLCGHLEPDLRVLADELLAEAVSA